MAKMHGVYLVFKRSLVNSVFNAQFRSPNILFKLLNFFKQTAINSNKLLLIISSFKVSKFIYDQLMLLSILFKKIKFNIDSNEKEF